MITYNPYNWEIRKNEDVLKNTLKKKQEEFVKLTVNLEILARHYNFDESVFWQSDKILRQLDKLLEDMGKIAIQLNLFKIP